MSECVPYGALPPPDDCHLKSDGTASSVLVSFLYACSNTACQCLPWIIQESLRRLGYPILGLRIQVGFAVDLL